MEVNYDVEPSNYGDPECHLPIGELAFGFSTVVSLHNKLVTIKKVKAKVSTPLSCTTAHLEGNAVVQWILGWNRTRIVGLNGLITSFLQAQPIYNYLCSNK